MNIRSADRKAAALERVFGVAALLCGAVLMLAGCSFRPKVIDNALAPYGVYVDPDSSLYEYRSIVQEELLHCGFKIVNRNDLDDLFKEMKLSMSGAVDPKQALSTGHFSPGTIMVKLQARVQDNSLSYLVGEQILHMDWVLVESAETIVSRERTLPHLGKSSAVLALTREAAKDFLAWSVRSKKNATLPK